MRTGSVSAMIAGGAIDIFAVPLPLGGIGIALSLIFLGLAIFHVSRDTSSWLSFAFVLFCGMFHGHAHGLERPVSASPAFYTFGFLISTSALHVTGVLIGEASTRRERLYGALRYS
jgi:urease accessory protein